MYTHLLDAALEQRPPRVPKPSRSQAVGEVRRCLEELEVGVREHNVDTVPTVLALQIGYDVALLQLADVVGVESGASRFEQPERERERLRQAINDMGINLELTNGVH